VKQRVLLVDDVADLRFLLRVVLETDGAFHVVGEAGDGKTAVELAAELAPDVILLDLSMPTMDGLEALPRLREVAPASAIAVLSGFEGSRIAASTSELGADAYFEKGTPPSAVVAGLKELLAIESAVPAASPDDRGVTRLADEELHAVLATDLRGPLAAIAGLGSTLATGWDAFDDETRRSMVARMTAQACQLQGVTDNMLAARTLDLDRLDVELEPVAPAALLTDLAADLAPVAGDHPLALEVAPALPPVVVDRERFAQVLGNLVTNAVRHSPPSAPVTLRARADGAWVRIEVCDRGPGIPHEHRGRVFEKHVRLAREAHGLGLGLFIAAALLRAMGGSISIEDAAGGGALVACRLRIADVRG
jgi:signal transduction histidine kinase